MSTDTDVIPLHIKLANSAIPDEVLLQLFDSVTVARQHREHAYSGRHSTDAQHKLFRALSNACNARGIMHEAGVKTVTQTINLLV